jgi:hypothetical protein
LYGQKSGKRYCRGKRCRIVKEVFCNTKAGLSDLGSCHRLLLKVLLDHRTLESLANAPIIWHGRQHDLTISRWILTLAGAQQPDGTWGRFHILRSYHAACAWNMRAYCPGVAINSAWLPSCTMCPRSITRIRSARIGLFLLVLALGWLIFGVFSHYFPFFSRSTDRIGRIVTAAGLLAAAIAVRRRCARAAPRPAPNSSNSGG